MTTGENTNSCDSVIANIIRQAPGSNYDELIKDRDAYCFYHLASLRGTLFSWFPFGSNPDSALEINGRFGALTGVLAEKFNQVDVLEPAPSQAALIQTRYPDKENIHIISTSLESFVPEKKYDAVIVTDFLEEYDGNLDTLSEQLSSLIADDGVILLGFCNRYAVKYRCGFLDPFVTTPFDTSRLCTKAMVQESFSKHFASIKWYYPMPDNRFVQAVYTDNSDFSTVSDRVFTFDGFSSPCIEDEKQQLLESVQDGTITEHANYYLAELRKKPRENGIREVYLSADREPGRRYQVTLLKETVCKSPLDAAGAQALGQAHQNNQELKSRGIDVLEESFDGQNIRMPRCEKETLLSRLGNIRSREEVISVFDQIWQNILISSDKTENGLLRTGYIDMIPFNIFYDSGKLIYYDQEFTLESCEPGYIQFRALFYSWHHLANLEALVPLEEMKQRYSISPEKWEEYTRVETEFVNQNRNRETFPQLSRWNYIPPENIAANRRRCMGYDSDQVKEVQQVTLDILKHFLKFCEENNLSCFALYGTQLGAVRHGGFVPWDEDIDIGMKREDFDRLIELYDNKENTPYYLQHMRRDGRVFYGGYAKLRRDDTTKIEPQNRWQWAHLGISIDIFPLDYCEEDPKKFTHAQQRISHWQRFIYAKLYPNSMGLISDADGRILSFYYLLGRIIPFRVFYHLLDRCFRKKKKSSKRAILAAYYRYGPNKNIFEDTDLNELREYPFEDLMIPGLKNADKYLAERYGKYYMNPPIPPQSVWNDIQYNVRKSYKEVRGW